VSNYVRRRDLVIYSRQPAEMECGRITDGNRKTIGRNCRDIYYLYDVRRRDMVLLFTRCRYSVRLFYTRGRYDENVIGPGNFRTSGSAPSLRGSSLPAVPLPSRYLRSLFITPFEPYETNLVLGRPPIPSKARRVLRNIQSGISRAYNFVARNTSRIGSPPSYCY